MGKPIEPVYSPHNLSIAGRHYLERLVAIAAEIFPPPPAPGGSP